MTGLGVTAEYNVMQAGIDTDADASELVDELRQQESAMKRGFTARQAAQLTGGVENEQTANHSEEESEAYVFSRNAQAMLRNLTGEDLTHRLVTPSDAAELIDSLMLMRGAIRSYGKAPLNYRDGLEALLSAGGDFDAAAERFGNSQNAAYMSLRNFFKKCAEANGADRSFVDLARMSNPDYELTGRLMTDGEVKQEQDYEKAERALGRRATSRTIAVRMPRPVSVPIPDDWFHPTEPNDDEDGPLSWQLNALCAQSDPEAFFPEKGGSTRDAKRICASCDVQSECLNYALQNDERFGIWGGLSERERRKLKRRTA